MSVRLVYCLVPLLMAGRGIAAAGTAPAQGRMNMKIDLSEPIAVVVAPAGAGGWGWYQFPTIERLPNGALLIQYQLWPDTQTSQGTPRGKVLSTDGGETWRPVEKAPGYHKYHNAWASALALPNGDMLAAITVPALKVKNLKLAEPVGQDRSSYGFTRQWYLAKSLPRRLAGWHFVRWRKRRRKWVKEAAEVRIPGAIRFASVQEGVLRHPHMDRMKIAPDGSIWGIRYDKRFVDGKVQAKNHVMILRSTDAGRSWDFYSEIPYQGDSKADPNWVKQEGFSEPDAAFMPDGSVFCLMRTTYGLGPAPMYSTRSTDGGKTWSTPKVFDKVGVWPQLVALKCGVTLAAYGRPGLFLRATDDPSGQAWRPRITVVEPGRYHEDTCSYSAMMAIDDTTALLVYSDFRHVGKDGKRHKAIKVRKVTVHPPPGD